VESLVDQAANRLKTPKSDRSPCAHVSLGLRTVAVIEAAKGTIVLLLACGVVYLIQESDAAGGLFRLSPIHEDGRLSILFTDLASRATYGSLRVLAVGALAYAACGRLRHTAFGETGNGKKLRNLVYCFVFAARVILAAASSQLAAMRSAGCQCCDPFILPDSSRERTKLIRKWRGR